MITEAALMCLAVNIYHEANTEPLSGQMAVSLVVLNRAKQKRTTACKEVYRLAQFSWTLNPFRKVPRGRLKELKEIARISSKIVDFTGGATHYHANYVKPYWSHSMTFLGQWGNHLFYKE